MSARPASRSAVTARADAFVEAHLAQARGLGYALAELVDRPPEFQAALEDGLAALADPEYAEGMARIAPGVGPVAGVRTPLLQAISRGLRPTLRTMSSSEALWLALPLAGATHFETRTFAVTLLRRSLAADPERSWQIIRAMASAASSWVDVDTLARATALGVVTEAYRWTELEQFSCSPSRWERRLVGSTIATLPSELPRHGRAALVDSPALRLIASLMGDPEPDVQKALSWALRTWGLVDPAGTAALLQAETERAATTGDGNRAWVIRDSLQAVPATTAAALRQRLAGIRRHSGAATGRSAPAPAPTEPTDRSAVA